MPIRIRLPYASEEEFTEKYGMNVAKGGIFIATRSLKPEGSLLAFELVLEGGGTLLRGEGQVVKAQVDEGGGRSGMTVRFLKLDAAGKQVLDRILAARARPSANVAPEEPQQTEGIASPESLSSAAEAVSEPSAESIAPVRFDLVVGIDIGTSYCRLAVFSDGKATLAPLGPEGEFYASSALSLDEAGQWRFGDGPIALSGLARLIGSRARSLSADALFSLPFPIMADSLGDAALRAGDEPIPLSHLYALLLEELISKGLGDARPPMISAVISVPTSLDAHQRNAIREAAQLAGVEVLALLSSPAAVALAFGLGKKLPRKRLLVYDMGAGHFSTAVVELTGDDVEVAACRGDSQLGGFAFDAKLADELWRKLGEHEPQLPARTPEVDRALFQTAERLKAQLSTSELAEVEVSAIAYKTDGEPLPLRAEVSRNGLENLTASLVDRSIECVHAALKAAGATPAGLDDILVIGGQTLMPLINRRLQALFERPLQQGLGEGAAALGAAIYGHGLAEGKKGKRGARASEVLSAPIDIAFSDGKVQRVLEQNTRLPAKKTLTLKLAQGEGLNLLVFQGTSPKLSDNSYLGRLMSSALTGCEVTVSLAVEADGTLTVSASDDSGKHYVALDKVDLPESELSSLSKLSEKPEDTAPPPKSKLLSGLRRFFGRS